MASLEDLEKRVTALEERVGAHDADLGDIPRLVTMHFDLLRAELRAMERRVETRFDTKLDATTRAMAEMISELKNELPGIIGAEFDKRSA